MSSILGKVKKKSTGMGWEWKEEEIPRYQLNRYRYVCGIEIGSSDRASLIDRGGSIFFPPVHLHLEAMSMDAVKCQSDVELIIHVIFK